MQSCRSDRQSDARHRVNGEWSGDQNTGTRRGNGVAVIRSPVDYLASDGRRIIGVPEMRCRPRVRTAGVDPLSRIASFGFT